jgi:hypothetical protein
LVVENASSMTPKDKYNKLGTLCVILIVIVLVINLCVAVITMISIISKACKKAKGESQVKISQVAIKMKKIGLDKQFAQEKRSTELAEIERRKRVTEGLEVHNPNESRVNLNHGVSPEEFEKNVAARQERYKKLEERKK